MRCRWKNRRSEPSVVASPCASATRATISSKVRSGSTATSARSQSACGSNGERLRPPRGNGLTLPVSACRLAQRTAEDTPTRNRAAAARRELPPDTSATTRVRRSSECVPMPTSRPKTASRQTSAPKARWGNVTFDSPQPSAALGANQQGLGFDTGFMRPVYAWYRRVPEAHRALGTSAFHLVKKQTQHRADRLLTVSAHPDLRCGSELGPHVWP
jgi:hypothetical protein